MVGVVPPRPDPFVSVPVEARHHRVVRMDPSGGFGGGDGSVLDPCRPSSRTILP